MQVHRGKNILRWTFEEYYRDCCYFASALLELGITERNGVNIAGFNSPEWAIAFFGRLNNNYG